MALKTCGEYGMVFHKREVDTNPSTLLTNFLQQANSDPIIPLLRLRFYHTDLRGFFGGLQHAYMVNFSMKIVDLISGLHCTQILLLSRTWPTRVRRPCLG